MVGIWAVTVQAARDEDATREINSFGGERFQVSDSQFAVNSLSWNHK
jgi:hypothetical protein